jgi:hypothetical protein
MKRYSTIPFRKVEDITVTSTTVYPEVASSEEDYYIISSMGDRFDILAKQFYGNQDYWWVIASVNPNVRRDTMYITPGLQLRVPPLRQAIELYQSANNNR